MLVVDDAAAVRRLVTEAIGADPELEVVGTAENGRVALDRVPRLRPDVIVLDIEMPVMGGLEMLTELRRAHPRLPVIVFSSDTRPGAEATLDALWLGASDYVTKSSAHSPAQAVRHIHAELVPRIKALCMHVLAPPGETLLKRAANAGAPALPARHRLGRPPARILALGASTGGPNALAAIFRGLAADFPVPIVIAQHMPPLFTRFLADRLSAKSEFEIVEAEDGDLLHAGKAWIAPGDFHMTLEREGADVIVHLDREPPVHSCRPSVDVLFQSVAEIYGATALGVILTGMGQDGLRGCESLARAQAQVLAQDEATSVVWGMPGNVVRAGLAEAALPLDELAAEITQRVAAGPVRRPRAA